MGNRGFDHSSGVAKSSNEIATEFGAGTKGLRESILGRPTPMGTTFRLLTNVKVKAAARA